MKMEILREYIERFTKVGSIYDKLQCWMFQKGLREDYMFHGNLGLEEGKGMSDFLTRVNSYINYEKKL